MIPKDCKRLADLPAAPHGVAAQAGVDFPIAEVSKHAAREKSIRHGHPSTLHLWWARRFDRTKVTKLEHYGLPVNAKIRPGQVRGISPPHGGHA